MAVSVVHDHQVVYPDDTEFFSPSAGYPEYPFSHIASRPNHVYDAVRRCLEQAGLDKAHFGTSSWNPLRSVIPEGSSVFVLCNFVYHRRPHEGLADFFSKCTHGSVLRAIIDYVLLAIGDNGVVRFGNAPIQSCIWQKVLEETGAATVVDFYRRHVGCAVEACDLRSYIVRRHLFGGIKVVEKTEKRDRHDEIVIDLAEESLLEGLCGSASLPRFRSLDYNPQLTKLYHGEKKHAYVLNKKILEADIVVNVPKLKTHEKVGATLAIKNCVGSIAHKHCLAHFRLGSPRRGGDEYQAGLVLNWLESTLDEFTSVRKQSSFTNVLRTVTFLLRKFIYYGLGRNVGGGWAGNDTTWRMAMDIARILKYADRTGALGDKEARKMIVFVDGIVSGEGNGPLRPRAKPYGYLSYCEDIAWSDYVGACFMGLDPEGFPIIREAQHFRSYPLTSSRISDIQAIVNGAAYGRDQLRSLRIAPFELPAGWIHQAK